MSKLSSSKKFLHDVWALTRSYWQSEEKKKAYALLTAICALTLAIVYMLVLINHWYNDFYAALQVYQSDKLFSGTGRFTLLAFLYIIFSVYSYYLQQVLIINWRRWLTNRYIDEWLVHKTYYKLEMFGQETDNPDQRISEDVRLFVEMTLKFTIGILKSCTTLVSFVFILWDLSGALDFTLWGQNVHIEGYLVWTALLYSICGTYITYKVGNKLVGLNYVQQKFEADFRFSMMRLRESAESVAFYSGEGHEGGVFKKRFSLLLNNFWSIVQKQKQLIWINSGYSQIAIIFPLVVALPRYLAKKITLGGLMQISSAFQRVQDSLSYFVDMYATIAEWQAVVERLTGFGEHIALAQSTQIHDKLVHVAATDGQIRLSDVTVGLPDGRKILEHINLVLTPQVNVLIKGVSGSGKSTLLRMLSGIWPYAEGTVAMPEREEVMFIPQRPYLPLGTLRESVLYPGGRERTDEELVALLKLCHIGYLAGNLHVEADWSHVLSVGEQQRLAFMRAIIYQPKYLFLDEATSALDEPTEKAMYLLLATEMPETTVVSVGHRSTLSAFHKAEIVLDKEERGLRVKGM